ncbi:MAG: sel1 repeat family protein [Thermoguttaceae bacterium]|nr:sel1 repeat family protein [Thermoguttaceae bacterium]
MLSVRRRRRAEFRKALEYFGKAAAQGLPDAKFNLGRCYCNGRGVCEDKTKALALYEEASRLGLDDATTRLGRCYHYGEGVERNEERAVL